MRDREVPDEELAEKFKEALRNTEMPVKLTSMSGASAAAMDRRMPSSGYCWQRAWEKKQKFDVLSLGKSDGVIESVRRPAE